MRNFNLSATVDLEIQKFKAKAKEAEEAIKEIEDEILRLRKLKLDVQTGVKKGSIKEINQLLSAQNIKLKEQGTILRRNNAEQRKYVTSLKSATGAQSQFRSQVGASNSVALEFNRIIQDAPFGIVGIGNNIQQLTANFAQLKAGSASTGQAILSSLKSIVSPINLVLLGVSVLTSLWTAYQLGQFGAKEATDELADALDALDEEIQDTIKSLSGLERAFLDASSGAVKEQAEIDSLFSILKDANVEQSVRVGAYEELIKKYPKLLEGLTKEKALTGDLTLEYEKLTRAVEAKALASALQGELVDSIKEERKLATQLNKEIGTELELQEKLQNVRGQIISAEKKNSGVAKGRIIGLKNEEEVLLNQLNLQQQIGSLTERLITAQGLEAKNLKNELIEVNKQLAITLGFGNGSGGDEGGGGDNPILRTFENLSFLLDVNNSKLKTFQDSIDQFDESFSVSSGGAETQGLLSNRVERDIETLQAFETALDGSVLSVEQLFQAIALGSADGFDTLDGFVNKLNELQIAINNSIGAIEEGVERTIGDVAFSVGEALALGGNALNAGGSALLGGLSNILNELGNYAIGVGVTIETVKKALSTLNGALAIGAGVALIALAGAFRGASRKLSGNFAGANFGGGGGSGFAGASAGFGASSTSFSGGGLGFQGFSGLNLTSRVSGTDLILVIDRSANTDI